MTLPRERHRRQRCKKTCMKRQRALPIEEEQQKARIFKTLTGRPEDSANPAAVSSCDRRSDTHYRNGWVRTGGDRDRAIEERYMTLGSGGRTDPPDYQRRPPHGLLNARKLPLRPGGQELVLARPDTQ